MKKMNFLKRKLRNNCVAWCIGVPYTEEQFKECVSQNSDFIKTLSESYRVYDNDLLWEQYKITANLVHETVKELESRNVKIVHLSSLCQMKEVLDFENIIVTAHHHRFQFAMEFLGNVIPIEDFIATIPIEYSGTIDVSSCYSAVFLQELKLQASNARIIAANTESSLDLRMFIYKHLVKYLAKNNDVEYLDAYKAVTGKIVSFYREQHGESAQKVMLGGRPQSVSVFAPSEVGPKSRMMVQVYLHPNEQTEKVKALATESDKNAERRDYVTLQAKLKKGDKVDVVLNINGERLLFNSSKSIVLQGSFCKCAFDYLVPSDLDVDELSCSVNLYVNGAIVGEMLFYTHIVDSPAQLNANVIAKPVKKLFISYSHNDLKSAEKIAKLYEGMDVDVFFDKHRLKSGYIYSDEIFNFIRTADTFVLCWSENAAQSEYVEKERKAALELAYPNFRPREDAQISIKPFNIQPYATPPNDMIEHYHFEEL